MTNAKDVSIRCAKCAQTFEPDLKSKRVWRCPQCDGKNPNLKRHYRSVADLCILGLIAVIIFALFEYYEKGLTANVVVLTADAILLLVTNLVIYKSRAPWANSTAKMLIWAVFGLAFLGNLAMPLLLTGTVHIGFLIVYAIVLPYLFWLDSRARKCMVQGPLETRGGETS
jgi:hypothetical protein